MRVWFVVCLLLLMPSAGAQGIFATETLTSTTNAGPIHYDAVAANPLADNKAYLATNTGGAGYATQWNYPIKEAFIASGEYALTFYISCDTQSVIRFGADNPANPVASARATLTKDEVVINQANLFAFRTCDGPDDIWEAVFTVDGADTPFVPGNVLNLQLLLWGPNGAPGTGAENFFVYTGTTYPSGITGAGLPGGAIEIAAPEVVYGNLTGPNATIEHDWASSRNSTFVYNWTAPVGNVSVELGAAPTQGNASVLIRDAEGVELHNATYGAAMNETLALTGGNWTIQIAYEDYVGTLRLFAEAMPEPITVVPPMNNETAPPPTGNETVEDNDSPGLPMALAVTAFVAVAAVVRRKQG